MVGSAVATRAALLIARRAATWTIDEHLSGRSPDCVAVDPRDPDSIASGLREALKRRDDLGREGLKIAGALDWSRVARETVEVYREVAA